MTGGAVHVASCVSSSASVGQSQSLLELLLLLGLVCIRSGHRCLATRFGSKVSGAKLVYEREKRSAVGSVFLPPAVSHSALFSGLRTQVGSSMKAIRVGCGLLGIPLNACPVQANAGGMSEKEGELVSAQENLEGGKKDVALKPELEECAGSGEQADETEKQNDEAEENLQPKEYTSSGVENLEANKKTDEAEKKTDEAESGVQREEDTS